MAKLISEKEARLHYRSRAEVRRAKRRVGDMLLASSFDAEKELERQTSRAHSVHFAEPREYTVIDESKSWLPQGRSKRKRAEKPKDRPSKPYATDAVSFTLREGAPYPFARPYMEYITAWNQGYIADSEMLTLANILSSLEIRETKGGETNVSNGRKTARVPLGKLPRE